MGFIIVHINGPRRFVNINNKNAAKIYYLKFILKDYKKFLKTENIYKLYIGQDKHIDELHKSKGTVVSDEILRLDSTGTISITIYDIDIYDNTPRYYELLFDIDIIPLVSDEENNISYEVSNYMYDKLQYEIIKKGYVNDLLKKIDTNVINAMTVEFKCKYYPYKKLVNTQYKYILNLLRF